MIVRLADKKDIEKVSELIANFRVEHRALKGIKSKLNIENSKVEFQEFYNSKFPIYIVEDEENILAYLILRIIDNVVWVEHIYVSKAYRKKGIAKKLFNKAEEIAKELGNETVYNWILPNNDKMIKFLSKNGYNVLNMIEIRKEFENEDIKETLKIGEYSYKY